ncbi:Protease synthase and sporulation negative regulatory protein PAI 1 [Pelotomaculum sp. FP]|uniref:GNAT family N-acetyltransferase n=1 Tax=Pelotomaculum sp. FP TaxID=261474 RepID=UPI0011046F8C|nr:GNAT family N-acetyltransferase [Pelotomaculum sp. FP]TEB14208.1 Protease synthase and sporulation negative regulatory protein PAI 1 [Pelotomaculum sp. FP]
MKLTIRECTLDNVYILREFPYKTYNETFRHMNTPSNMKAYLEKAFDINKLRDELLNSSSLFYFLYADEELAGYYKLNEYAAQTDINDPQSIEIERIYVTKQFQGRSLGSILLNKAIDMASIRKTSYIWLGVWGKNDKAILFYKKNGFYVIGQHSFFYGRRRTNRLYYA